MDSKIISGDIYPNSNLEYHSFKENSEQSQDCIYRFFLDLVQNHPPERVLVEFKSLFFKYQKNTDNASVISALTRIVLENDESTFIYLLKRSCYILINNWDSGRHYKAVISLVDSFSELDFIDSSTSSGLFLRLRNWLKRFIVSKDYLDLQVFVAKYDDASLHQQGWSNRYLSYLLVSQSADLSNSQEQRETARLLSQQLKEKFKFDLAMYTARSHDSQKEEDAPKNPTNLGEDTLRLIKKIVAKQGRFSYGNIAHIFLKQNLNLNYQDFKVNLQKYLVFSFKKQDEIKILQEKIKQKLKPLYEEHEHDLVTEALLLRTCNQVFDYLTSEDGETPSDIFILLMSQGNSLTLVILLLKIILISPNSRVHLETRIANLVQHYMQYPEEECQWVVKFFEVFKVTFTIYADKDVQYNLIKMKQNIPENSSEEALLDAYRIFAQRRYHYPSELSP